MYALSYVKAKSVKEAADFLAANPEAKLLAGGMTLIPTLKQRLAKPSHLVDIGHLQELRGIEVKGGKLVVGAGTKHFDVASSAAVAKAIPALADLAGVIGDPQVRNMGTMGGSVANNDPAADYPAAVLGLERDRRHHEARNRGRPVLQGHVRHRARATARSSCASSSRCRRRRPTASFRTRPRATR